MGSGKDPSGQNQRLQSGYDTGFQVGSGNPASSGSFAWEQSDLGAAQRAGYEAAQSQPMFEMPSFEMPDFSNMFQDNSASLNADYQARLDAQAAENARNQALSQMNDLYSARLDAANSSVDYVNSQINEERSNAALMGIDYDITQEDKTSRINNYFASVWGEGDETNLANLMGEYGAPTGHSEFTVIRGDASGYDQAKEGSTTTVGGSKGMTPKKKGTAITEESGLGGGSTVLGGA